MSLPKRLSAESIIRKKSRLFFLMGFVKKEVFPNADLAKDRARSL